MASKGALSKSMLDMDLMVFFLIYIHSFASDRSKLYGGAQKASKGKRTGKGMTNQAWKKGSASGHMGRSCLKKMLINL